MTKALFVVFTANLLSLAYADQSSFTNSGGSSSAGSGVNLSSTVANPPGALNLTCNGTGPTTCAAGTISFISNDGTSTVNGAFTSGTFVESCSGGGRGGHVTCSWAFTGYFNATWTLNGSAQAVTGVTYQGFGTGGAAPSGTTAFNSAYVPFYYSDSEQLHRSDDLMGTNQISYGAQGSGVGQFYGANAIALDTAGRIYIADTYNGRVVRIDNMTGTNWTSYGTYGSGPGQFKDPLGIAVDRAGKIYVMDTGNSRLVRMNDMTGANWTTFASVGSGVGQLLSFTSVAVDSSSRIYIADSGNLRIVRMDDVTGANWTSLTQSQPVNGVSYTFSSPAAVAVDSAGKVYVADNEYYAPAVIRVDDMTGANWTSLYVSPKGSTGLNSISVDATASVFTGGGGARAIDGMVGVLTSSGSVGPIGSYYVFGVTPVPLPSPRPSAISFTPPTLSFSQNVGTTSPTQSITVTNFGGSPLAVSNISATGAFAQTNNCTGVLSAGSTCTVSVSFTPSVTGPAGGSLNVSDDSGNLGAIQALVLSGTGTAPAASLSPTSLAFGPQVAGTTSMSTNITLQNTGTGPNQISNVVAAGPFAQTNTCIGTTLAPSASCTISVSFSPVAVGAASGSITITDAAGTQTVSLSGNGSAPVQFSTQNVNFGSVVAGETSAARSLMVTNRLNTSLSISGVMPGPGFAISTNTCGSSLAVNASCTISVTFSPTTLGAVTGALTFTDSAITSPQTVTLSGSGAAPVTLSGSKLNFGTVAVGKTSLPQTVTLMNRLNVALSFSSIATAPPFAITTNTCGTSIAAAASCKLTITFSPTVSGSASGTLKFTDSALTSPQTVTLSGIGQ